MSGGWTSSDRGARLPANWPALREATRRQAGGQCQWVGEPFEDGHHPTEDGHHPEDSTHRCTLPGTDADHITAGDNHAMSNLQWLCSEHHKHKTQAEARAAAAKQRTKLTHPGSRNSHPGLIG